MPTELYFDQRVKSWQKQVFWNLHMSARHISGYAWFMNFASVHDVWVIDAMQCRRLQVLDFKGKQT